MSKISLADLMAKYADDTTDHEDDYDAQLQDEQEQEEQVATTPDAEAAEAEGEPVYNIYPQEEDAVTTSTATAEAKEPEATVEGTYIPQLPLPTIADVSTIAQAAQIVSLSIGKWGVNKQDRGASKDVQARNKAKAGMARVHKTLMNTPTLKQITQHEQATRQQVHNRLTSPWDHTGGALLPNVNRIEYQQLMEDAEAEFWRLVDKFCDEYEDERAAVAADLGDLYNAADYPNVAVIRSKFKWRILRTPVPDNTWQGDLTADEVREAERQYAAHYQEQINNIIGDRWKKLYTDTRALISKISYDTKEEKKNLPAGSKKLYDSSVEKIKTQIDMLRSFNMAQDPRLTRLCDELSAVMDGKDADSLKENDSLRRATREKLTDILDRL